MSYFNYNEQKIFYEIKGEGKPVLLIHGNSVSSGMFSSVIELYAKNNKVITFDFPGHGKSSRLKKFETDFWFYNSEVAYALLEELNLDKVAVIGTSGGALVGINLALEHPEKVSSLIADSFEGDYPLESFISTIKEDRKRDKMNSDAKTFWSFCHGKDWERVVDMDTDVIIEFTKTGKSFFHKSVSELSVPTILTGSKKDEYCNYLDKIYEKLKLQNPKLKVYLFEEGGHPAMLSNYDEFYSLFLKHC